MRPKIPGPVMNMLEKKFESPTVYLKRSGMEIPMSIRPITLEKVKLPVAERIKSMLDDFSLLFDNEDINQYYYHTQYNIP